MSQVKVKLYQGLVLVLQGLSSNAIPGPLNIRLQSLDCCTSTHGELGRGNGLTEDSFEDLVRRLGPAGE